MRIAVLEDEEITAQLVQHWLEQAGHECKIFHDGSTFKRRVAGESFDLFILDWLLPDTSGDEVLIWLRETIDWHVPILFVTVVDTEENIVRALTLGADDYMVKPVKQGEMLARVAALGRRSGQSMAGEKLLRFPPYEIDLVKREVTQHGEPINLTNKEFDLVLFLFRNAGRIISRGHLLETVWGSVADLNTRTVDTHISRIRNKLGLQGDSSPWRLSSIYMHGYRLESLTEVEEFTAANIN